VPKSTPVRKRAVFVFLPPLVALVVGVFLIVLSFSAAS
jgi:hypothetical protein